MSVWAANRQLLGPAELAVMFHQLARVADPAQISLKALEMSKVRVISCTLILTCKCKQRRTVSPPALT